ncbi:hypothetical protein Slin15195_G127070 [Septoria linicola]|uniref:Uncharacterized protein n=1 Tax=Septoria linicola TaxID=215465 RepID=A0A9Q9ESA1_9PEZI|nr:hypothetical protein Slin15195_G127070 [Septoria linicola]
MPNWRKASTAKSNASSMPQPQDQSARPERSSNITPSDDGQTPSEDNDNVRCDDDNFSKLMRHSLQGVYGAEGTEARCIIWVPPRAAVQQFIERTRCPADSLRITPAGIKLFENALHNSSLAGSFSNVERFLRAVPSYMRSAIKKVYCFIDDDAPSTALRMYTDRWTGILHRVNADAWKEAEKARRSATETLMGLLGENLQMAQVFSDKSAFISALDGITQCAVAVPKWPDEQAEASTQGQPQHGAAAHGHANGQGHRGQLAHGLQTTQGISNIARHGTWPLSK